MAENNPQPAELSTLHELLVINEHHAASLESVAGAIEDRGLGQVLSDFAFDCEQFGEKLKAWIESRSETTDVEDHTCDPIDRAVARHESRDLLLASTEQAEQKIIERYQQALERINHPDLRRLLFQQYDQLQDIHNWLHRVRLAAAA